MVMSRPCCMGKGEVSMVSPVLVDLKVRDLEEVDGAGSSAKVEESLAFLMESGVIMLVSSFLEGWKEKSFLVVGVLSPGLLGAEVDCPGSVHLEVGVAMLTEGTDLVKLGTT